MTDTVKLIIEIPTIDRDLLNLDCCGQARKEAILHAVKHATPLYDVIDELEKHKFSREYCAAHDIDWAIDMGMVRTILNNIETMS